jgi:hypothetical protein
MGCRDEDCIVFLENFLLPFHASHARPVRMLPCWFDNRDVWVTERNFRTCVLHDFHQNEICGLAFVVDIGMVILFVISVVDKTGSPI